MKFIHMADCHVGAWRDPKMRELTHEAFTRAIDRCLEEKPDFILIAGDLFNTAIPGIDSLKLVVKQLQRLKAKAIPVYSIAGSHDYSPSGKSMLDVLEEAGLLKDVMHGTVKDEKLCLQFIEDKGTGVKMTGILGRKGSLDRHFYEDLERESLEQEPGRKIFLFHTSIAELKPKHLEKMDAQSVTFMPRGFDYYAGGHVHIVEDTSLPEHKNVVYPGPVFPASFSELEQLKRGGFCIVEDWKMRRESIEVKPVVAISIDANKKQPEEVQESMEKELEKNRLEDGLVLLRVQGELSEGKVSDIDFRRIFGIAYDKGAYFVMKNTGKLTTHEYEEITVSANPDQAEDHVIREHLGQEPIGLDAEEEFTLTKELMAVLAAPQKDGEKKYEYEERITASALSILENVGKDKKD